MTKKRKGRNRKAARPATHAKRAPEKSFAISRRAMMLALGGAAVAGGFVLINSSPATAKKVVVYKNPSCGCCSKWADHMRAAGYSVEVNAVNDMADIKEKYGTPWQMESCHTTLIDGYVIEGHVPVREINRLLAERPKAKGLAVPGMPAGSPGMEGRYKDAYNVMLFQADGSTEVYAKY